MNKEQATLARCSAWRDLYKSALFEKDKPKMLEQISKAEVAVAVRARELFQATEDNAHERRELDATMHALRTLRFIARFSIKSSLPSAIAAKAA